MTRAKSRFTAWTVGVGAFALTLAALTMTASAAEDQTSFNAHYNQNLQLETQLLQKAESEGTSSAAITALSNTVHTINSQITSLYSIEEGLAAARSGIPQPDDLTHAAQLKAQRQQLQKNIAGARAKLRVDLKEHHYIASRKLQLQMKIWAAQVNQINYQLRHPGVGGTNWRKLPYDNGLTELQDTIFDLQKAAIHYTQEWINDAKPTVNPGNPISITGFAYATETVTIPSAGSVAATDSVAVMPIVKDSAGNVLVDSGTFQLAGPSGSSGVTVDSTTGEISVGAGATAGTYKVTYTQGGSSQSVAIVVSQ